MSKIVSFDFDGTLAVTKWPEIIRPIYPVVEYAKQCKVAGDQIILNTMREGARRKRLLIGAKHKALSLTLSTIMWCVCRSFIKNNPRKIFADEYIDDHNLVFAGVGNGSQRNLDKYAVTLCEQFALADPCCLDTDGQDCDDCEPQGICHDSDKAAGVYDATSG